MTETKYGLMHETWRKPSCFFYDSVEAARTAIKKAYGPDSGHRVVGPIPEIAEADHRTTPTEETE